MPDLRLVVSEKRPKGERLRCERCPIVRQAQPGQSLAALRHQLRAAGWLCVKDVDVCPECRAKPI